MNNKCHTHLALHKVWCAILLAELCQITCEINMCQGYSDVIKTRLEMPEWSQQTQHKEVGMNQEVTIETKDLALQGYERPAAHGPHHNRITLPSYRK